ncbi:M23 family metallopeptidase [Clostridium carnis]
MDQNKKNKVKDFFRKEGFYLVLFLCLCVVATVAVVTTKKNKLSEQSKAPEKEFTLNVDDKTTSEAQKQNADRVQNEKENEVANNNETEKVEAQQDVNVAAGTTTEVKFKNPVEGAISRSYSFPQPKAMKDGTSRNIRGIDIKATVGTEVKAAAVGEVKEVAKRSEEGNYVVITHANGLSTKYCNLDSDIKVNIGDKVTAETVIGAAGESSKIFTNQEFGEHVNIQVQDSTGKDLNPTTYFTYSE